MRIFPTLVATTILIPVVASAEVNATRQAEAPASGRLIVPAPRVAGGPILAQHLVDLTEHPPSDGVQAVALSRVIYLNRSGATLSPGNNNSGSNTSSLVPSTRAFPAWNVSNGNWNEVVGCVRQMFSRFDVEVTDVAPAAGVRHIEALFGGTAVDALPASEVPPPDQGVILGVSPWTTNCSVIESAIVFTFTESAEQFGLGFEDICEIATQEIAHAYGLDHALVAADPMSYLQYSGLRAFQDVSSSCGEYSPRSCGVAGFTACRPNQNSVALLRDRLGQPSDLPPTMSVSSPQDDATVPPGFQVRIDASDDGGIAKVELFVDGTPAGQTSTPPYVLSTSPSLDEGRHDLEIIVEDTGGNVVSETLSITVDTGSENTDPDDPAPAPDDTDPRVDGVDDDIYGGCMAGQDGSLLLTVLIAGLVRRRRR